MRNANICFIERAFPSANMILVKDRFPIIIDTGFGSEAEELITLIEQEHIHVNDLALIVNTHYHSDHVGGNAFLQHHYEIEIAAHEWDAQLVNNLDPEVGASKWLDQPIEQYVVNIPLRDGDIIKTGDMNFQIIHTPGHTLGHISLYEPERKVLIAGDLFHKFDVGWLNMFREGIGTIYRALESLKTLLMLDVETVYTGHGPPIKGKDEIRQVMQKALERLNSWQLAPDRVAWHGCKRIFAYTLMIKNGLHKDMINDYLLQCGWFHDFSTYVFQVAPEYFVNEFLEEMIRSRAAKWEDDSLFANAPYNVVSPTWMANDFKPNKWLRSENKVISKIANFIVEKRE